MSKKRLGYLGPRGTFSEEAAQRYLQQNQLEAEWEAEPRGTFWKLFEQLNADQLDAIIVPIENSIEGPVNQNLDLLAEYEDCYCNEELVLPIEHCLLLPKLPKETKREKVKYIYSHPQVIAQCRKYIEKNFPDAEVIETSSSARAAIATQGEQSLESAIIGSQYLAQLYDELEIVQKAINDNLHNHTRFMIISKHESKPTGRDKTVLVFSTKKDKAGSLCEVLQCFAKRNINLTSIFSRPAKTELGEYVFYVDFLGHMDDPEIREALQAVQKKAGYFKPLGSFRRDSSV